MTATDAIRDLPVETVASTLVAHSSVLRAAVVQVSSLAHQDLPLLIVGEPGVGKTIVAQQAHARSRRRDGPLVAVSCGAAPAPQVFGVLFGSRDVAGFARATPGAVHRARHGSLLLESITELDPSTQCRLLEALSDRRGSEPRSAPRLIATAECLPNEVPERWRESLLATRLSPSVIRIPPLRERLEDLAILVGHFAHGFARRLGVQPPEVLPEALAELERRSWPGNVRELRNAVERAVILRRSRPLDACAFATPRPPAPPRDTLRRVRVFNLRRIERATILAALREAGGHQGRASRLLGISTRTLRRRLQDRSWGIESVRRIRKRDHAAARDIEGGRRGPGATSSEVRDGTRERARPDSDPEPVTTGERRSPPTTGRR